MRGLLSGELAHDVDEPHGTITVSSPIQSSICASESTRRGRGLADRDEVVVGAAQRTLAVQPMVRLMLAAQQMPVVVDVPPRSLRRHM